MAILNKIREKTLVLILVIALALFAFILSGLIDNAGALIDKQNVVATINGKEINRNEFMAKVEQQQRQLGPNATTTQIMNRLFDTEVRKAVMDSQFEKLGMSVEADQIRDILETNLASSPQFQNEAGLFDKQKLNDFINNLKEESSARYNSWINYEQSLANNALQSNYFNMVKAGSTATLTEGEVDYKLENEKVNIAYVTVPYTSIKDEDVTVSDSEIKSYISKNASEFQVEASRDLKYVFFEEKASLVDEQNLQNDLTALLTEKEVFNQDTNTTEKKASFTTTTNIEAFVNENSDDLKYNDSFVTKKQLPSAIANTIFDAEIGKIVGPYKDGAYFKLSKLIANTKLPDSVKARHILIPFVGSNSAGPDVTQTEEQAKTLSDSLLTVIKSDNSKFADLVTKFSKDQGSISKGGSYDYYDYATMVPEFRDFTFQGKTGDIGVVKSVFGFHIIEIEGQKGEAKLVKVATIARKIEPSEATNDKIFRDASNFELALAERKFDEIAKEMGTIANPVTGIKQFDESIPGLGNQRQIVQWAFKEGAKVNAYKQFNIDNGYVIVQTTAAKEKGLTTVADASVKVLPILRKEKKAEIIKNRISATTLADIASAEKTTIKTASAINLKNPTIAGAGREPLVVGTAFGLKEGTTSGLITGERGVYAVQLTKLIAPTKLDSYQSFANQLTGKKINQVQSKLYDVLKDASEIEDNRVNTIQ